MYSTKKMQKFQLLHKLIKRLDLYLEHY